MPPTAPTVVLIGAGHTHLHVIARADRLRDAGAEVVVVSPGRFWYSGLATGMLGGMYEPAEDTIDIAALLARRGVAWRDDRVVGLDAAGRRLHLASGETLGYDLASFNVGSVVATPGFEAAGGGPGAPGEAEAADGLWAVKPIANLAGLRKRLESAGASGGGFRAVVAGGGPTGCEVAAGIAELGRKLGLPRASVTLLTRSGRLLAGQKPAVSRSITGALEARGVEVRTDRAIARVEPGGVVDDAGGSVRADAVVLATGLRASPLVHELGLPTSGAGLRVDEGLRSVGDERVFGAGDCIDFAGRDLPKLGVFGVRQGPVLLANLLASLRGGTLRAYRPQRRYLMILNLGRGEALAIRGGLWWRGRSAMWLKDRLDRRFLAGHRK